jgi:hypothetical protein
MSMRLFVTHDGPGPQWQLGSPSSEPAAFTLIGWNADPCDGAVSERVVDVLARSLTAFGRVTFPCSTITPAGTPGWQRMEGSDFIIRCRVRSFFDRLAAQFSGRAPIDLTLLSTIAEPAVRRLFDDSGFPWWLQSQFALLSAHGAVPPDFDQIKFNPAMLFERKWPEYLGMLHCLGVQAIVLPGVDGDVAGLLFAANELRDRVETILSRCAQEFGMTLYRGSETEFAKALSSCAASK